MADDELINAYADALFEVARAEGSLGRVEDELFSVARTIETNDALRNALTDQVLPIERRLGIVEDLLGGRASSATTASLVSFVIGAGRARDLSKIIDRLVEKAAESRSEEVAEVRTRDAVSMTISGSASPPRSASTPAKRCRSKSSSTRRSSAGS